MWAKLSTRGLLLDVFEEERGGRGSTTEADTRFM